MSVVVGIDPGLTGAIAVIDKKQARVVPMPTMAISATRREVDAGALLHLLLDLSEQDLGLVVLEKVGGQPGWGAAPSFAFGHAVGKIQAVVEVSYGSPLEVRPQQWKKAVLGDLKKWSKKMAVDWVRVHYPGCNLVPPGGRVPSHDWAEAVCLAHYGVQRGY